MTVQSEFWDWGARPMTPNPGRCAPICQSWMRYLLDRWGGQNVGCWVDRPIVGGTAPSAHASGAAIDWRYQSPGMGRQAMLDQVMPWLLDNSRDLGVQAVHDYAGMRIWRPPGQSGRPPSPSPECGWRPNSGSQMNPANTWLHIECLNTRWSDTRSVDDMLPPPPPPEEDDMTDEQAAQLAEIAATVDQLVGMVAQVSRDVDEVSAPAAAIVDSAGTNWMFYRATDGTLAGKCGTDPAFTLGGEVTAAITARPGPGGVIDVFCYAPDGNLTARHYTGAEWQGWFKVT